MAIARGELVSLPELAIPYVRAQSAIFDAAIWRRYQDARAAIRKTGERMSVGARLALPIGVRPCGGTDSSSRFDRLPGVLILELHGAEIAECGM